MLNLVLDVFLLTHGEALINNWQNIELAIQWKPYEILQELLDKQTVHRITCLKILTPLTPIDHD